MSGGGADPSKDSASTSFLNLFERDDEQLAGNGEKYTEREREEFLLGDKTAKDRRGEALLKRLDRRGDAIGAKFLRPARMAIDSEEHRKSEYAKLKKDPMFALSCQSIEQRKALLKDKRKMRELKKIAEKRAKKKQSKELRRLLKAELKGESKNKGKKKERDHDHQHRHSKSKHREEMGDNGERRVRGHSKDTSQNQSDHRKRKDMDQIGDGLVSSEMRERWKSREYRNYSPHHRDHHSFSLHRDRDYSDSYPRRWRKEDRMRSHSRSRSRDHRSHRKRHECDYANDDSRSALDHCSSMMDDRKARLESMKRNAQIRESNHRMRREQLIEQSVSDQIESMDEQSRRVQKKKRHLDPNHEFLIHSAVSQNLGLLNTHNQTGESDLSRAISSRKHTTFKGDISQFDSVV